MDEKRELVTWETFRGKFLSEYFPDSVRYAKEVEFLQLTQGGKTVMDYAEKFKHLNRFYTFRSMRNGDAGNLRTTSGEIFA